MTVSNTITIGPDVISDAHSNIEMYIVLLQNELDGDFEENCRTQRLTSNQKQLLPLLAQLLTAHSLELQQDVQEEISGALQDLAVRK